VSKVTRKLIARTSVGYTPVEIYKTEGLINNEGCGGCYHKEGDTAVIDIEAAASKSEKFEFLLHEIVHAIDHLWCLGLSERKVRMIGMTLCQALRGLEPVTSRRRTASPKGKAR
jgi:hypothetical protein